MSSETTLELDGVFSSTQRHGAWNAPRRIKMRRRMGSVKLDFTEATLPTDGVDIEIDMFGGSLEIRVPETTRVDESLSTRLASYQGHRSPRSFDGPHLVLHGRATWCSVEVRGPRTEWRPANALLRRFSRRSRLHQ